MKLPLFLLYFLVFGFLAALKAQNLFYRPNPKREVQLDFTQYKQLENSMRCLNS